MVYIGVDFGTTYCCMYYYNGETMEGILDSMGNRLIPTCVYFSEAATLFGRVAMTELSYRPWNTITNIKRLIARQNTNINLPYETCIDKNTNQLMIVVKSDEDNKRELKKYSVEEIVSMILDHLRIVAEEYLSLCVTGIVLTAPAYFDQLQKETLIRAAKAINLPIVDIISEPTAAALCYKTDIKSLVLVYDIGGGTLDVTLLECQDNKYTAITKIGDPELGGVNFTEIIESFLLKEFLSKYPGNDDIYTNKTTLSKVRIEAENIKIRLSEVIATNIIIDNFYKKKSLETTLSRLNFETLSKLLFDKCDLCLGRLLKSINPNLVITDIIFIGGTSRMPNIRNRVLTMISERQSVRPATHNNINPDEAVAIGAAKHAFSLSNPNSVASVKLTEVLSRNIGIQVGANKMDVIVEKNTRLPCVKTVTYATFYNNQVKMRVRLFQGDDPNVKYNKLIGILEMNIRPRPKGEIKVILSISVMSDGMLTVSALEQDSNSEKKLVINNLTNVNTKPELVNSNIEAFKKIKRLIVNKDIKDPKYLDFVTSKEKVNIEAESIKEFNDILTELLAL